MEKTVYKEIASGKINENKSLVISECSRGGYTLGQKISYVHVPSLHNECSGQW